MNETLRDTKLPLVSEDCPNCACAIHIDITRELAAERAATIEECRRQVATGRTITNFAHLPEVVRALEWVMMDLDSLPRDRSGLDALLEKARTEGEKSGISGVLRIRCLPHRDVPQFNRNEASGGECCACAVEETRNEQREKDAQHADAAATRARSFIKCFPSSGLEQAVRAAEDIAFAIRAQKDQRAKDLRISK